MVWISQGFQSSQSSASTAQKGVFSSGLFTLQPNILSSALGKACFQAGSLQGKGVFSSGLFTRLASPAWERRVSKRALYRAFTPAQHPQQPAWERRVFKRALYRGLAVGQQPQHHQLRERRVFKRALYTASITSLGKACFHFTDSGPTSSASPARERRALYRA